MSTGIVEDPVTEQPVAVQDHPDYPNIIDYIELIGEYTKTQLVDLLYDESGDGDSKTYLRSMSKAKLLALAVDAHFGVFCQ